MAEAHFLRKERWLLSASGVPDHVYFFRRRAERALEALKPGHPDAKLTRQHQKDDGTWAEVS